MRKTLSCTIVCLCLFLQMPHPLNADFPYDVNALGDLSPGTPVWQWEVSSAVLPGSVSDQLCSPVANRQAGDPQLFLSSVSGMQRIMTCPLSLLGTSSCDAVNGTGFDLGNEFGMCGPPLFNIYVPTSNDNVMVRLHDGRVVQVVQTIKLNCPAQSPPACNGEDREQVSYVVRVSDDCGQHWTPSVLDATEVRDLNGNLLNPLWKGFDRVEVYADPWSDHILLTSQPGPTECCCATETAFLHASTGGGMMTFNWQQLFTHAPASVPTVMTSLPHSGAASRVYWFNCEGWAPTLFFADNPWNGGGAPQIYKLDSLLQQTEGNQTTSQIDFQCMLLPSSLNLCEPGSSHPNCARADTAMGQGIHWECVADPNHPDACPAGTTAETRVRNLIFNTAIARVDTDGSSDVIRIAYPQLTFTQNRYYQRLRIVDVRISPDGAGGFVVTPRTNRIIDAAANQTSPASVFYPSIIQVDRTTANDPSAGTHMLRWTEFNDVGGAREMLASWDTTKSWVGSSTCPQSGTCPTSTLWNPDKDIDTWVCSGDCSPGDYQYGAFIDTLDTCTHRFFVPWGVQAPTIGTKTHGAVVRTTTDDVPPVFDAAPVSERVSCESVPPPPILAASDNCDTAVDVVLGNPPLREDGSCPDSYKLTRTWTATDNVGNTSFENQTITVEDIISPSLSLLPDNQTVECDAVPATAQPTASDNCDPNPVINFNETRVDGSCLSSYQLIRIWAAADRCGNSVSETQLINVQDTTAPSIDNIAASPNRLWPPNGKMVPVRVNVTALDNCGNSVCRIVSVASNEPDNALGDGNSSPDWEITGPLTVNLRAERSGGGNGRVYTLAAACTDGCGNISSGTVSVAVPHDKRK